MLFITILHSNHKKTVSEKTDTVRFL